MFDNRPLSLIPLSSPPSPLCSPTPLTEAPYLEPQMSSSIIDASSNIAKSGNSKAFQGMKPLQCTDNAQLAGNSFKLSKKRSPRSITWIFQKIIMDLSTAQPGDISVGEIAKTYGLKHRRVYDFFNLLSSIDICLPIERGKLEWNGIDSALAVFAKTYLKFEISSLADENCNNEAENIILNSLNNIVDIGPSPSLGTIATHFMALYFYLNTDELILRHVSAIFHNPKSDIKSLERRMYLVLNFLEMLGFVTHTMKSGSYKVLINRENFYAIAFAKKKEVAEDGFPQLVEAQLQSLGKTYQNALFRDRQEKYMTLVMRKNSSA